MKRPHLVRVASSIESFSSLIERAASQGLRVGWLGLAEPPLPPEVATIVESGVVQCVMAGERWTIAARARAGPPVCEDLLRRYFLGCQLVLVRGDVRGVPTLLPDAAGWQLVAADGERRSLDDDQLVALFHKPAAAAGAG